MSHQRTRGAQRPSIATTSVVGIAFAVALTFLFAEVAQARSDLQDHSVTAAAESALGKEKLLDVKFFMAGQEHLLVEKTLGTYRSNQRTNAFNKSDEKACQVAFLSAIIRLQKRAIAEGGDAVVDIKSITKHNDLESATEFRCAAGNVIANVALEGTVARLAK